MVFQELFRMLNKRSNIIFILFLFVNVSFSALNCVERTLINHIFMFQVSWIFSLLFILILFSLAILFTVAYSTNNLRLMMFVKEELAYVFLVVGLILISDLFFVPLCLFMKDTDMHSTALNFMIMVDNAQKNYIRALNSFAVNSWSDSAKYYYTGWFIWEGEGKLSFGSSDNKANYYLADSFLNFLVAAQISTNVQLILLQLIDQKFLLNTFIIGLCFKLIPGIRDFGNVFFAIGISLYFLVPFIYANYAYYEQQIRSNIISGNYSTCFRISNNFINYVQYSLYFPEAFFLPNMTIAIVIICINSLLKGMNSVDSFIRNIIS